MKDQRTIEELRSTVAGRDMAIDEKNLQIAELRSDVVQMGNAISFKNVRLKNKQAVINRLKEQINRLESTYDSMHSAMLEDNQAITKDLKACQRNACARKAELYKKEINRLRRIIGMADEEINELSSRYCDRCDQLEEIKKIIMEK